MMQTTKPAGGGIFYGWWVVAAAFLSLGIAVGLPYYNLPFFYDYYQREFHWTKGQITFGFPLAALLTLWVGPLVTPRIRPRRLILVGTALTFGALVGFGAMRGSLAVYYALWFLYAVGYIISGPIPHQLIISHWFHKHRGKAMGMLFVGIGLVGFLGSYIVKPLTERTNFHSALMIIGVLLFLSWPLVIFVLRDRASDMGLFADGASEPAPEVQLQPVGYGALLKQYPFWLLLVGSFCSVGAIGSVNFHMKFVFLDNGFTDQTPAGLAGLNAAWRTASMIILASSIAGRLVVGTLADRYPKKWVMTATYFSVAATVPILMTVRPEGSPALFALLFGFGMGADYLLIPLMAAEQFGVNSLARALGVILPVNLIGQTWLPYFVAVLRERAGSYEVAMGAVFVVSALGALAIMALPRRLAMREAEGVRSVR